MKEKNTHRAKTKPFSLQQNIFTENVDEEKIVTDPDGSWTGVPEVEDEEPIQDVDDL